jgi:DNA processing protein
LASLEGRWRSSLFSKRAKISGAIVYALIREGAALVQSAEDIFESIGRISGGLLRQPGLPYGGPVPVDIADADRQRIMGLLSMAPVAVDEIIRLSGCQPGAVQTALLELEIAGALQRHAGGRVSLSG